MTKQTRERIVEVMARSLNRTGLPWQSDMLDTDALMGDARKALDAIEAAGVRLVPVNEKPGQGWLHEAVKDACLRSVKNMSNREPPQLLYAPILWAMQDALTASPYAPKEPT